MVFKSQWLEGFSIKTREVTGFLGISCIKKGGEEGAGEENRCLTSKNEELGGLFITTEG